MKCRIDKRGGQVFTPNNEVSQLFNKLQNITGDFQSALDIYAIVETPQFQEYQESLKNTVGSTQLVSTEPLNTTNNEETRITELGEPGRDRREWDPRRGNQTLEGAPNVEGATGADPELTSIAEEYAKSIGIDYRRQSEYVKIDPERASRIAQAYDEMEHLPQDPNVIEAYQNLIQQTIAQYKALERAGYKFYLFDETNDPYEGNPWNAMRDLRNNKVMGSFATESGFGTGNEGLDVSDNPLLQDTGITWGWGSVNGPQKRVLANDLFRAVHDAFGHGIEGSGFRARGEENAWQAHARLFTGSAVAAITSETRGQNSWLNFGKYGEQNRTAKVEDTVFAPQKTGLMPEWTWKEGFNEGVSIEQSGDIVYQSFDNRGLRSHMFILDNTTVGSIRTKPVQGGEKVDSSIVYGDYRGQGIGTELYLETVRNLMIEGKKLYSDNSQSAPAKRIWEKLVEFGIAIKTGPSNFETIPAPSWVNSETTIDEIIDNQPIDKTEPSLKELMDFINMEGNPSVSKVDVIELMQSTGITDSQVLLQSLSKAEVQGIFIFTQQSLRQTGLFDKFEIVNIMESKERQKSIKDTLKWLRQNSDFEIQPTSLIKTGELLNSGKVKHGKQEGTNTVLDIEGNPLKSSLRLRETIEASFNEELSLNISFLNQIVRETTWDNMSTQIKDILKAIEVSAIDNGIDLSGLTEKYHSASRNSILDFLESLEQTLEGSYSVYEFESLMGDFLNKNTVTEVKELKATEVIVNEDVPADFMFSNSNLLKVGPTLYKRMPNLTYDQILQAEANRTGLKVEEIDREANRNFDRSLEDIETAKALYLLKNNLRVREVTPNPNVSSLDTFTGNFDYLTTQFTKDFSKWLIESKNTDFRVDSRGITLVDINMQEVALEKVPSNMLEDLKEYSKLSKYLEFNLNDPEVGSLDEVQLERDHIMNNPQNLNDFSGSYITLQNGEGIMVRNGQGQFIKVQGQVFEQVEEHSNLVFYKPLPTTNSLMEIDVDKPALQSNVYDYTLYQTTAKEIKNLNNKINRTDYEC